MEPALQGIRGQEILLGARRTRADPMVVCGRPLCIALRPDGERDHDHYAREHGDAQKARAEIERGQANAHESL
jgi:hypothetical protein